MAKKQYKTGFEYLISQPPELDNPLQAMHRRLVAKYPELGITHNTSSNASKKGLSHTQTLQVSFIPPRRNKSTQS